MTCTADFSQIARKYKKAFDAPCGKDEWLQTRYKKLCEDYGEGLVLEAFDDWAIANSWKTNPKPSLLFYFKECKQWIDDIKQAQEEEKTAKKHHNTDEAAMLADRRKARKRVLAEEAERNKEQEAIRNIPPDAF